MPEAGLRVADVVRARSADVDWILKLQYLCYQVEARRYDVWDLGALTESSAALADEVSGGRVLAVHGPAGEVVGSVRSTTDGGIAHIGRLVVHPRVQRRGIGTRLLQAALRDIAARAAAEGIGSAEAYTGHRSTEFAATYLRCGLREAERRRVSETLELVHYRIPVMAAAVGSSS